VTEGRRLPTFLVIGAMKAGTSSLYQYLRAHPQIFMPEVKEPQFFASNWDRGLAWYERLFERAEDAAAIGEASTEYTKFPHISGVPHRIRSVLPPVRMVYLVRDPIERMISEYQHRKGSVERSEHGRSLEEALLHDPSYCDFSRYAMQIEQYLEYFSRDRLLVVRSEDLRDDRARTLRKILLFLGVEDRLVPPNLQQDYHMTTDNRHHRPIDRALRRVPAYRALASTAPPSLKRLKYRWTTMAAPARPSLSEQVRTQLRQRLRDDVVRLRAYLGDEFDGWGIA
jgi:hypothetical protein